MRRRSRRVALVALMLLAAASTAAVVGWRQLQLRLDPFMASAVRNPPFPSLTYGVQAFLWWDTDHVGKHLDWVELMSYSHVKQTFAWRDLEAEPGRWDWTQADRIMREIEDSRLRLILRLGSVPGWARQAQHRDAHDAPAADPAHWRAYCAAVAGRYRGKVAAYQIWNEPNLSREWGGQRPDPAAYVALLAACSEEIRAADPGAVLISAGLAPTGNYDDLALPDDIFLDHMYRNDFQKYIDAVGAHAPGFAAPEIGPDDEAALQRWFTFRRIEDLRKIMLMHGDEARQMAVMEFGYTTEQIDPAYEWFAVSEAEQADLLQRAYEYAIANWRPWVGLMVLIYLPDPSWGPENEEFWWSIVDAVAGRPRPAFITLANMRKVCDDYVIPQRASDSPTALGQLPAPICP